MGRVSRRPKKDTDSNASPASTLAGLSAESIYLQVEKVIESWTFRSAAAQRDFLRHAVTETVQGRGHLLKEYSIGLAVFRKKDSFDPRVDSIVRAEARRLRTRLAKYYETEGEADSVKIEIPLGRYAPVFRAAPAPQSTCAESGRMQDAGVATQELLPQRGLAQIPEPRPRALIDAPWVFSSPDFQHRPALRIAVLPFVNRSAAQKDEFFSDGLTDELTHAFSQIPGLEVVARTSAFQFKGHPIDIREIGRRLNVHAVVEGSVRRAGNQLRVLAQLDDAVKGHMVWSASYDRRLADLFAVQREISTTITDELGARFCGGRMLIGSKHDNGDASALNPAVYQEYLRGQYFWNRHTIQDFEAAIGCFRQAIAKETRYARAYASLAYCYVMLPILKAALPSQYIPKVRTAATKALEIDSYNGDAHIALALPLIHDYNWPVAGEEFRRGLDLSPSNVIGHSWYGTYLVNIGRGEEGLRQHRKVLDLDPTSSPALFCHAQTLYLLHRYDEAIERIRRALALNPGFPREHALLGLACIRKGSHMRGLAELEMAQNLTRGFGRVKADLAYAHAVTGNRDRALETLSEFLAQFTPESFPAAMIAEIYIGLGDKDRAFEWLHRAIDQKDLTVFLYADPLYDPLRSDPRFQTLLKRMNLA